MVGCDSTPQEGHTPSGGWLRRFVVLLPQNQLSDGGIITNWIDSADWVTGIEYRRAARCKHLTSRLSVPAIMVRPMGWRLHQSPRHERPPRA